jgi:hypothetical protein
MSLDWKKGEEATVAGVAATCHVSLGTGVKFTVEFTSGTNLHTQTFERSRPSFLMTKMHLRRRQSNLQNLIIIFPEDEVCIANIYTPIQVDIAFAADYV